MTNSLELVRLKQQAIAAEKEAKRTAEAVRQAVLVANCKQLLDFIEPLLDAKAKSRHRRESPDAVVPFREHFYRLGPVWIEMWDGVGNFGHEFTAREDGCFAWQHRSSRQPPQVITLEQAKAKIVEIAAELIIPE